MVKAIEPLLGAAKRRPYLAVNVIAVLLVGGALLAVAYAPRLAHFTATAHVGALEVRQTSATGFLEWRNAPVDAATPDLPRDCESPRFTADRTHAASDSIVDVALSLDPTGALVADVLADNGRSLGVIECAAGDRHAAPHFMLLRWPASQASRLNLPIQGFMTLGQAPDRRSVLQHILLEGRVMVHVKGWPFERARLDTEEWSLHSGDRVSFHKTRERDDMAEAHAIVRSIEGALHVTLNTEAAIASVLSFGQRQADAGYLAPTALARIRAVPEWPLVAIAAVMLFNIVSLFRAIRTEEAILQAIGEVEAAIALKAEGGGAVQSPAPHAAAGTSPDAQAPGQDGNSAGQR
ncbi:MAG: hypothetical protein NXI21_02890 [Alphaproteobacteria bacterium]|nr:hypothetical protein [Alphaproteobacteria bacterium]